jgi:hypothetical protein
VFLPVGLLISFHGWGDAIDIDSLRVPADLTNGFQRMQSHLSSRFGPSSYRIYYFTNQRNPVGSRCRLNSQEDLVRFIQEDKLLGRCPLRIVFGSNDANSDTAESPTGASLKRATSSRFSPCRVFAIPCSKLKRLF